MANVIKDTLEKEIYDENGILTGRETTTSSKVIHKTSEEGDYIKIYINFLEELPADLKPMSLKVLLYLCKYLNYADISDLHGGMLIQLTPPIREEIQTKLNIKRRTFYDYLKNLTDCKLLREVGKSCYQINPNFIGKGYYTYKPTYEQGGIADIRENWNEDIKQKTVYIDNVGKYTKSELQSELDELTEEYKTATDRYIKQDALSRMSKLSKALKQIDENEYIKVAEYIIRENEKITQEPDEPELIDSDAAEPEFDFSEEFGLDESEEPYYDELLTQGI